jgi:outer membrane receptor protein involved in Fe transport
MRFRSLLVVLVLTSLAATAFGQGVQTATLHGSVRMSDGTPLPGVTVTATSPALMGERVTVTASNGDYIMRGLPPGEYRVTFTMDGMQTIHTNVTAGVGSPVRADAEMWLSVAAEAITVIAESPSVLETTTIGKNTTWEEVQKLPVGRSPVAIAALAGGISGGDREARTPVAGQISISGGMAYDNNIMINGVNVQDPIFGTTNNLFIEDAIQETQVLTSAVSAEYGHFTGGVLNVITRSGGNQFFGSVRGDFSKPDWRDETPFEKGFRGDGVPPAPPIKRSGDLGEVYSLTLGGPIMRDRLWFFGSIRDEENTSQPTLAVTGINVPRVIDNRRWELKLTGNLTASHNLQASYVENPVNANFEIQVAPLEMAAIGVNSARENDGSVINYSGVWTPQLFAEARYSEKHFGFRGLGGTERGIVDSPMRSLGRHQGPAGQAGAGTFNAPYFDATDPEDRDNEQIYGSLSYYLSTPNMGSHDIKGGAERFTVTRTGGNSQSSTDYVFYTPYLTEGGAPVFQNGRLVPRFVPVDESVAGRTTIGWWVATRGAQIDIVTDSFFLQDRWDINPHWTANLGVRYEKVRNDVIGADVVTFDTDTIVPRLALSFDPLANGQYKFDVSYSEYAGRYNPALAAANTPVGRPALLYGYYAGPSGSGRNFAPGFDLSNYVFYYASVPVANIQMDPNLSSPIMEEISVSAGMALPRGGWAKASFIDRNMTNFIDTFITIDLGCTQVIFEGVDAGCFDNILYSNTSEPERKYQALLLQSRYNLTQNWQIEGNYTHELKNHGNYEGEAGQSIPTSTFGVRPEIQSPRNNPTGRLAQHQEHKFRAWTTYTFNFGRAGSLSSGLIYRYDSPLTFSYTTTAAVTPIQRARQPNYRAYPTQTIFFGDRGAGEFNSVSIFDLALNYTLPVLGGRLAPWIKVDVNNLLNSDRLRTFQTPVSADPNSALDADGLRTGFIQGAAWGRPSGAASYVVPREFLLSAGIRF